MKIEHNTDPFDHLIVREVLDPDLYQSIKFPDLEPLAGGRIGRDLYVNEPGYDQLIGQAGWREAHAQLTGEPFVKQILGYFEQGMEREGCLVDPAKVHLDPFPETRAQTQVTPLQTEGDPNALFTRFDFQAADVMYTRPPHVDWPRRVVGGVFFFCSHEEEKLEGGEFGIYRDRRPRNDRECHKPELAAKFPIMHNTAYLFLNSNRAFHGALGIKKIAGLRKWVYFSVSSRVDVWPHDVIELTPIQLRLKRLGNKARRLRRRLLGQERA